MAEVWDADTSPPGFKDPSGGQALFCVQAQEFLTRALGTWSLFGGFSYSVPPLSLSAGFPEGTGEGSSQPLFSF